MCSRARMCNRVVDPRLDRYNIVDETDLAKATRKIEARNQPSISANETHTELKHANVRVS